jgi:hypothetical protein
MSRILIKGEIEPNSKLTTVQGALGGDFAVTHLVFNSGLVPGIYLTGVWQNERRVLPSILSISVLKLTSMIEKMVLKAGTELKLEFSNKSKSPVSLNLEIHGNLRK